MVSFKGATFAIALTMSISAYAADVIGNGVATPPNNSTPPEEIEKPAAPSMGTANPQSAGSQDTAAMPGGTLSEKLDQSNGVITPKSDVDPKIEKPAPSTGSMPVLTPPAGPGSKSGVEAK